MDTYFPEISLRIQFQWTYIIVVLLKVFLTVNSNHPLAINAYLSQGVASDWMQLHVALMNVAGSAILQ